MIRLLAISCFDNIKYIHFHDKTYNLNVEMRKPAFKMLNMISLVIVCHKAKEIKSRDLFDIWQQFMLLLYIYCLPCRVKQKNNPDYNLLSNIHFNYFQKNKNIEIKRSFTPN